MLNAIHHVAIIVSNYEMLNQKLTAISTNSTHIYSNRDNKYSRGKEKLFAQWGYTIEDAKWLQAEIEKQGRNKYISGDYTLGKLDLWGQRINIRIELQRRDTNDTISFNTGWMLKPDGKIVLNTPYGGK